MSTNTQSLLNTQKTVLNNLLAVQGTFFTGFEKLVDLNLKATKAAFEEVAQKSQEAIELKDAQELLAFGSALARPEHAVSYGKDVYDILSEVQSNLRKLSETQLSESQKQLSDAVEQFAHNAPTGSEGAVALLKSSLATATNAYETATKAARQAADAAESNFTAATNATLKAAADANKPAKTAKAAAGK